MPDDTTHPGTRIGKPIDDGGPAFSPGGGYTGGLSARDYFAAAALTGFLAAMAGDETPIPEPKHLAENVYRIADAMLAERKQS